MTWWPSIPVDVARRLRWGSTAILLVGPVVLAGSSDTLRTLVANDPQLRTASTVFSAVFVQVVPFLVLGVVVSGLVAAFVSPEWLARKVPQCTGAVVLVFAAILTSCSDSATDPPSAHRSAAHNAADVTFAQNMIPHHQQAVVLAAMVPAHTANAALRVTATHIGADQQAEIRTLNGLLAEWGEPVDAGGMSPRTTEGWPCPAWLAWSITPHWTGFRPLTTTPSTPCG